MTVVESVEDNVKPPKPPKVICTVSVHKGTSQPRPSQYISAKDLKDMDDKWAEHCARFEALLTMGNMFTTLKIPLSPAKGPVFDKPFIPPASALATSTMMFPTDTKGKNAEKSNWPQGSTQPA